MTTVYTALALGHAHTAHLSTTRRPASADRRAANFRLLADQWAERRL